MIREDKHIDWDVILLASLTVIVIISLIILFTGSKRNIAGIDGYIKSLPNVGY